MSDIQTRRMWSLSTGKSIDECEIQMTADAVLHRPRAQEDNIRVELVLRNALDLYMRGRAPMYRRYSPSQGSVRRHRDADSGARHFSLAGVSI